MSRFFEEKLKSDVKLM